MCAFSIPSASADPHTKDYVSLAESPVPLRLCFCQLEAHRESENVSQRAEFEQLSKYHVDVFLRSIALCELGMQYPNQIL